MLVQPRHQVSTQIVPIRVRKRIESRRSNLRTLLSAALRREPGLQWMQGGGRTLELVDRILGLTGPPGGAGGELDRWAPRMPTGSTVPFLEGILCCSTADVWVLRTNPELSDWSGMTALLRASWTEHKKSARPDLSVFGSVDTLPPRGAREVLAPKDASPSNLAGAILTGLLLVAAYAQLRAGPKATSWLQYPSPTQILLHDMKHVAMWTRYGRFTKSATLCDPPAAPVKRTGFKRPHTSGNAAGPVPAATAIPGVIEVRTV